MLESHSLVALSQFRSQERPVISLYLAMDRNSPDDRHLIHLKNMMAAVEQERQQGSPEARRQLRGELERIRNWVRDSYAQGGQNLALFACGEELWAPFEIPYPVPSMMSLGDRPRLRPLYRLLQRFERYLALLTDGRDARFFLVTPSETREMVQIRDETPGRHEQGGRAQARLQRHQDRMVDLHLSRAADLAFQLYQEQRYDGLILMGIEERTIRLEEQLHPYLRQRVLARVPLAMDAGIREIEERVLRLGRANRQLRQRQRLKEWEENLRGGSQGVAGLAATLRATQQGQVMTLIMRENLKLEGGACERCGALTPHAGSPCAYCGGLIRYFDDVTEALTAAAIGQGAELIFIPTDGETRRLNDYEGVGAILRYVPS